MHRGTRKEQGAAVRPGSVRLLGAGLTFFYVRDEGGETGVSMQGLEVGIFVHRQSAIGREAVVYGFTEQRERLLAPALVERDDTKIVGRNRRVRVVGAEGPTLNVERLFQQFLRS